MSNQATQKTDLEQLSLINANGTFVYSHRESSCLLWFKINGKWQERADTLILTYNTECINNIDGKTKILLQETRFLIEGKSLIFEKQIFKSIGYFPERDINLCSYTLKERAE